MYDKHLRVQLRCDGWATRRNRWGYVLYCFSVIGGLNRQFRVRDSSSVSVFASGYHPVSSLHEQSLQSAHMPNPTHRTGAYCGRVSFLNKRVPRPSEKTKDSTKSPSEPGCPRARHKFTRRRGIGAGSATGEVGHAALTGADPSRRDRLTAGFNERLILHPADSPSQPAADLLKTSVAHADALTKVKVQMLRFSY